MQVEWQEARLFQEAVAARESLSPIVRRTPILADPRLDDAVGRPIVAKAEHLQRGGSFKFRGLAHKIASLGAEADRGILVVSSGNAAQAAALAARLRGVACTVVMPDVAPQNKVDAVETLGATIVRGGATSTEMFARAAVIAEERQLAVVHPFDQPEVIAGHGGVAFEVLEDCPDSGTIFVPASGGGLLAAVGLVVRMTASSGKRPRVVGVQPAASDSLRRSLKAGTPLSVPAPIKTIADALTAQQCGELTLQIISRTVDEVVVVDDDQICEAMRWAWVCLRQAIEPAAATSLAAAAAYGSGTGTDVAVLTGGNVDLSLLVHVTEGGRARP